MKLKLLILFLSYLAVSRPGCNDKNIQPVLPTDLTADKKDKFIERWTEGKLLFKANCVKCHGVFKKGKDSIPDFSQKQIQNYGALFVARDTRNHAVMQEVPPEDFYKILLFITYLKRQGVHDAPPTLHQMNRNLPYGFAPNE